MEEELGFNELKHKPFTKIQTDGGGHPVAFEHATAFSQSQEAVPGT